MHEPTVYSILQTQKGNKQVSRLLDALDELAGRLESVSGYETGSQPAAKAQPSPGRRGGRQHNHGQEFQSLQLPDPQAGALPLFPGASEFGALQLAANHTSNQLHSKAERQAWRSWLMRPSHFVRVIEAAWLLLSLVFKHDGACAAALQAYIFDQLAHHYVSEVLVGQAMVENAARLWAHALAEAACQLLRAAFPGMAELQDSQLQQVLHRQLRLWTTGLLPSDVGAQSLTEATNRAAAATAAGHDEFGQVDVDNQQVTWQTSSNCTATRCTAPFISVKPGPLVSAFMASKGLKPAALSQTSGPKLRSVTVPQRQLQQLQETLERQQDPTQQQLRQHQPQLQQRNTWDHLQTQNTSQAIASAVKQQLLGSSAGSNSDGGNRIAAAHASNEAGQLPTPLPAAAVAGSPSRRAQAAACVTAAAAAAEQYTRSKKARAATASNSSSALHRQLQQLQVKRGQTLRAGHEKVQIASNQIAGWLNGSSSTSNRLSATSTDAQCKAQRQLMEGHLRLGDWRMAHTFNATVHNKCLDMAAAVAVLPPSPAACGPTSSANVSSSGGAGSGGNSSSGQRFDRPGGGWADVAGCTLVSNRLSNVKSGAGAGSSIKITKAARAIVEDVQRKFAAAPICPSRRK